MSTLKSQHNDLVTMLNLFAIPSAVELLAFGEVMDKLDNKAYTFIERALGFTVITINTFRLVRTNMLDMKRYFLQLALYRVEIRYCSS